MAITFDPAKREKTLRERGVDFASAEVVFSGKTYTFPDERRDYGEHRFITVGRLEGRLMVVGWTPRGADRHVFTMRKANDREQARYTPLLR